PSPPPCSPLFPYTTLFRSVKELRDVLGPAHERVVDRLARDHAAHRHGAGGDALGKGDQVGRHAVALGGKGVAEPAETGDHLIEEDRKSTRLNSSHLGISYA